MKMGTLACVVRLKKYTSAPKRRKVNCLDLNPNCFIVCLIAVVFLMGSAQGKLSLTKQCGEIVCQPHYYCSSFDHICRPCQETCDKEVSNYDQSLCEKDCQDYLHDLFYMRKSLHNESSSEDEKIHLFYHGIQEELLTLKILLMITIIMSTVVLIALFILVIYLKKSRNRLGINNPNWCWEKSNEVELPVIYSNSKCFTLPRNTNTTESVPNLNNSNNSVNNNMSRVSTPDIISRSEGAIPATVLSLSNPPFEPSSNKASSKSQRFRREPSESTLPEYLGYDNPALAPSPTHI